MGGGFKREETYAYLWLIHMINGRNHNTVKQLPSNYNKNKLEEHIGLSMKTCKTISVIISKQRDASNINAAAFCIFAQQSLHIEWVFTVHLKSTRELSIRFLLLKQGIHFSYS